MVRRRSVLFFCRLEIATIGNANKAYPCPRTGVAITLDGAHQTEIVVDVLRIELDEHLIAVKSPDKTTIPNLWTAVPRATNGTKMPFARDAA